MTLRLTNENHYEYKCKPRLAEFGERLKIHVSRRCALVTSSIASCSKLNIIVHRRQPSRELGQYFLLVGREGTTLIS